MSSSACVVTSPMTTHRPFVIAVSQATRACASCVRIPWSRASETWSHTLSGWPSVTDSDVSRNEREALKAVATTTANHIGPGNSVGDAHYGLIVGTFGPLNVTRSFLIACVLALGTTIACDAPWAGPTLPDGGRWVTLARSHTKARSSFPTAFLRPNPPPSSNQL